MISYDEWKQSINMAVRGKPNGDNVFIIGYGDWIKEYRTYWGSLGEATERVMKQSYADFCQLEDESEPTG